MENEQISKKQHKAYKFRLYPNREQSISLVVQFGHARFVYNFFLAERKRVYKDTGKGLSYNATAGLLKDLKSIVEFGWLKDADSQVLQQALMNLRDAYNRFFKKQNGYPKFKSRKSKQSIRYPQRFRFDGKHTYLPKVGWGKTKFHRQMEGTAKSITVSKTKTGKYFVSILCEVEKPLPEYQGGELGVDVGLKHFAVTSDRECFTSPKHLVNAEKRLRRVQRSLSRRKKGSSGRERMRHKVALLHEKIVNQRSDFHHKIRKYLVETCGAVYLEDLNVKGMVKNRKLAKHISDAGLSSFMTQLAYKGEWYGCWVEIIDRFYPSSKTCSVCGYKNDDLTLKDREWCCPDCGTHLNRDLNAAVNILNEGWAGTARNYANGESVSLAINSELFLVKSEAQGL
ncbi:MAG: transposase [Anaerolineaceae bacterium]|nr:transposase [Anaerolineaceae bacterium]